MATALLLLLLLLVSSGEADYECVTSCDGEGVSVGLAGSEALCCGTLGAGGVWYRGDCRPCRDSGLLQPYNHNRGPEEWQSPTGSGDQCVVGECGSLASCQRVAGILRCVCEPGYTGDGLDCTDINECEEGRDTCDRRHYLTVKRQGLLYGKRGFCTNTLGSFLCSCRNGFTLEGSTCIDINECLNGPSPCAANAVCYNVVGSHYCQCGTGYVGDGENCCVSQEELRQFRYREMSVSGHSRRDRKRGKKRIGRPTRGRKERRRRGRSNSETTRTHSTTSHTTGTSPHTTSTSPHPTTRSHLTRGCERYLRRHYSGVTGSSTD